MLHLSLLRLPSLIILFVLLLIPLICSSYSSDRFIPSDKLTQRRSKRFYELFLGLSGLGRQYPNLNASNYSLRHNYRRTPRPYYRIPRSRPLIIPYQSYYPLSSSYSNSYNNSYSNPLQSQNRNPFPDPYELLESIRRHFRKRRAKLDERKRMRMRRRRKMREREETEEEEEKREKEKTGKRKRAESEVKGLVIVGSQNKKAKKVRWGSQEEWSDGGSGTETEEGQMPKTEGAEKKQQNGTTGTGTSNHGSSGTLRKTKKKGQKKVGWADGKLSGGATGQKRLKGTATQGMANAVGQRVKGAAIQAATKGVANAGQQLKGAATQAVTQAATQAATQAVANVGQQVKGAAGQAATNMAGKVATKAVKAVVPGVGAAIGAMALGPMGGMAGKAIGDRAANYVANNYLGQQEQNGIGAMDVAQGLLNMKNGKRR